jgi:hypothetical protein
MEFFTSYKKSKSSAKEKEKEKEENRSLSLSALVTPSGLFPMVLFALALPKSLNTLCVSGLFACPRLQASLCSQTKSPSASGGRAL